ncbi:MULTISPECIES: ATP phosphoribosyltransferase regulatory subunit [unclassified Sporolactobacillus]|uniref:ATP phosphoribosyltransferase regulatory subunit n=1 Tax=unclassified Sporolactobacillus TaxID=2628533 RepID=UPI002368077B|nr:ATP phosphoribosyltransferase regulatory subunit [Sporolactobacillus sp. CQH2019]MDD9149508.1 ATP phosphoribosyltransferase regulatory subunit [Sporolactobacillus sp. CQH2019]
MTQPFMFERPLGLRDTLPEAQRSIAGLEAIFRRELLRWGYDFIKTPALEYAETIGRASAIEDGQLFKFLDVEGRPVVLRPDMTTPIARIAASSLRKQPLPLRLAYTAALYRSQRREGGHPSEFEQTGAELIGDATPYADVEVISLLMTLLKKAGLRSIRLAVGHVGFVNAFFYDIVKDKETVRQLRNLLYNKNDVGFHEYVASLHLSDRSAKRLNTFIDSRRMDNQATLDFLRELTAGSSIPVRSYYQHIVELIQLLKIDHLDGRIDLDITLMPHLSYYTGFVFQGFGGGLGFPVASGGRYDDLLAQFHRPCPATGFGIRIDRLMSVAGGTPAEPHKQAVIYDRENAGKAMRFAAREREKGRTVVLQHADGITDAEAFARQFETIERFLKSEETETKG